MAIKTTSKTSPAPSKSAPKAAAPAPAKAAAPAPTPAKAAAPAPAKVAAPAPVKAKTPAQPTQEEIAARAFEIYQREGGNEQENWYRAERELLARAK
jgi:hypothetical protein